MVRRIYPAPEITPNSLGILLSMCAKLPWEPYSGAANNSPLNQHNASLRHLLINSRLKSQPYQALCSLVEAALPAKYAELCFTCCWDAASLSMQALWGCPPSVSHFSLWNEVLVPLMFGWNKAQQWGHVGRVSYNTHWSAALSTLFVAQLTDLQENVSYSRQSFRDVHCIFVF